MLSLNPRFAPFAERMDAERLPEVFTRTFAYYYDRLLRGETGLIPEAEIRPVEILPDADTLPDQLAEIGESALVKTTVVKLNGGLGTSMGLAQAKSLLEVKSGLSFLEIIARQARRDAVPLILMNSFVTHEDTMAALDELGDREQSIPRAFLQHKQPKIRQADLKPVTWPQDPALEWCPPGHGDIYAALVTSGTLGRLLEAGYEYAFVSNADNLGAVVDRRILGYFAQHRIPFMMEAADRTEMDRKGGHLAIRSDGRLILRELAQTPETDHAAFQDVTCHRYFNTNNLWLNLRALQEVLRARNNVLGLPMIRNAKTVDPRDTSSMPVYHLESAMGSAIGVFEGAQAMRVPRSRFAPVKRTDDLLAVRSDVYTLTENFHVTPTREGAGKSLLIALDSKYYKFIGDIEARFPYGPPSLRKCAEFVLQGDFKFGRNVACLGRVCMVNESDRQTVIPDGTVLNGNYRY